ncbi:zinc-dependent metalloprotease [Kangiella sp. TOML190]|uniref:zinc-dependent metalloprotease n=1 Tax=Kangiella sp. TOML190 TaxID=2931351 RepID=UPI00204083A1|nr:zinc-dependent metalloprotease [Kangiella sp. TOML190]
MKAKFSLGFLPLMAVILCLLAETATAKSWADIEAKSRKVNGFMPYYLSKSQGKVWLEVSNFNQPFIYYSGLPYGIGSNDIGLDRGQLGQSRLVQFERYGNKVLLKQLNTDYRADTDNKAEKNSIAQAFASSVLAGFEVQASRSNKVLIELTQYLLKDLHGVSARLKARKQGTYSVDTSRSALVTEKVKNFPRNIIFESLLTFKGSGAGEFVRQVTPSPNEITVQQHLSFVALPDDAYQPRAFHPHSGFFELSYKDYATPITAPIDKKLIYRHRIERNQEGKIKPIVYYLDPGVPEPVRGALLDGARWWQQAFDAIGLEGAYQVEMLPEDADPLDVRYNVIQWVHRATRGWSYGFSVSDPRTGEILKGHVTLGSLRVRQDLLIANALTAIYGGENADAKSKAAKEMALARIRQLSAHEVGHTLGIAHNFAASPDNRASVMDYPHPLAEFIDGQISLENAYAKGIGKWDIETVRYGYSEFADKAAEQAGLAKIVKDMQAQGLGFISDPDARPQGGAHPVAHLWDNGQDPAQELTRVLAIRVKALENFGHHNLAKGMPYSELAETLVPLYLFHRYQTEAAVKLVGGVEYEYSVKGDSFKPVAFVEKSTQEAALQALLSSLSLEVLQVPESILSLIPPKAYGYYRNRESFPSKTGLTLDPVSMADTAAQHSLTLLLNPQRLARLLQQKAMDPEQLGLSETINQLLDATLMANQQQGLNGLIQQRLDYLTLSQMIKTAESAQASPEVKAHLYNELGKINGWLQTQANRNPVRFMWLKALMEKYFNGDLTIETLPKVTMPPGSPIG